MGIECFGSHLKEDISQSQINECVRSMQKNPRISGILVQLPLPPHLDEQQVLDLIGPEKDVDGLHPLNIGSKINKIRKVTMYNRSCLKEA